MASDQLDLRDRDRLFADLEARVFDLAVIGGGITGAGVARDGAMRGLSVALVEAADFASGTSSRSSKMIHGGLRYLAMGDVALVREAASERAVLSRIAPHLARKTPFVLTSPSAAGTAKLRAAMWTFEKLGKVPRADRHEVWSTAQLAEREPLVRAEGLAGAVVYPEYLTDDARLTLANVRAAHGAGAVALNYAAARAIAAGAIEVSGTLPGEARQARLRARVVVNAAGPWADQVRALEQPGAEAKLALSRGVHLVVARERLPVRRTIVLPAAGRRSIFAVPRGEVSYIGTTDGYFPRSDYWPPIEADDVAYLFDAVERSLAGPRLGAVDIVSVWSGLRPLVSQAGKAAAEVSRRDEIWTGPEGVITIAGGKLSAYRAMAERVVDQVEGALGRKKTRCRTAEVHLPGGQGGGGPALAALDSFVRERLAGLYGGEAEAVAAAGGDVAAEAERAVLWEGAQRLEDYWIRRGARAWFDTDGGVAALRPAAERMAALLGWNARRTAEEIESCRANFAARRAHLETESA